MGVAKFQTFLNGLLNDAKGGNESRLSPNAESLVEQYRTAAKDSVDAAELGQLLKSAADMKLDFLPPHNMNHGQEKVSFNDAVIAEHGSAAFFFDFKNMGLGCSAFS